jgi:type IV secretion system protein VirB8
MIRRIKQNTPLIENTVEKAVDFEIHVSDIVERDHRRSWLTAYMAIFLVSVMGLSYFLIFPLSKVERYLLITNPYVNLTRVASLDDDKAFLSVVGQESVMKRSVTDYIRARESYSYPTTYYLDVGKVKMLSAPDTMQSYNQLHDSENPKGYFKEHGSGREIRVNFSPPIELRRLGSPEAMETEAIVRFQRFIYDKSGGKSIYEDSKIATIRFTFDRGLLKDSNQMASNPLGFYVTYYRVDNDNSSPPPPPDYIPKSELARTPPQLPYNPAPVVGGQPGDQAVQGAQTVPGQGQQIPQFGAPATGTAPSNQPQVQNPAQPAVQPQSAPPAGQAPNQVNGVRN